MNSAAKIVPALLVALVCAFVVAALGWWSARWMFTAYPPPENMQGYAGAMGNAIAFVGAITGLLAGVPLLPRSGAPVSRTDISETAVPAKDFRSGCDSLHGLENALKRKDLYKKAWRERGQLLKREYELKRRYSLWKSVLLTAMAAAFAHGVASFLSVSVLSRVAPHGVAAASLPWYLEFLHMLIVMPLLGAGAVLAYQNYLLTLGSRNSLGPAVAVGGGGALLGALIFLLQLSPEAVSFIMSSEASPSFIPGHPIPYYVLLIIQRLAIFPVGSAFLCCLYARFFGRDNPLPAGL